jgi:hypothetical protein
LCSRSRRHSSPGKAQSGIPFFATAAHFSLPFFASRASALASRRSCTTTSASSWLIVAWPPSSSAAVCHACASEPPGHLGAPIGAARRPEHTSATRAIGGLAASELRPV